MPAQPETEQPSSPRTLRARRTDPDATRFDPLFFEKDPLFWPIAAAAAVFRGYLDWPPVEDYARAFRGAPLPISFEPARPKPRRSRRRAAGEPEAAVDLGALYDGRITLTRSVPTRPRSWHDFLNALIWATFPAAKSALHARQYAAMSTHVPASAIRLPNARTRELDALAMLDEGGVIVAAREASGPADARDALIFGHALYEGLVLGGRAMIARYLAISEGLPEGASDGTMFGPGDLGDVDDALAARLADAARPILPESLPRVALQSLRIPSAQLGI
ncbi:DUF3025 domain-containing protein [Pendulispora albinea]|uniref:DUF3025 domain-containing protein n=1 Tax=Pendulispora albinea TaxID=2741071 RepID=A0ABZ2M9V9_9BACT